MNIDHLIKSWRFWAAAIGSLAAVTNHGMELGYPHHVVYAVVALLIGWMVSDAMGSCEKPS